MEKQAKIYVAGHRGLVGSAILRRLQAAGYTNFLLRSSSEVDLRNQAATLELFEQEKPEYVFVAAARVGGIMANSTRPAEFIYDNLAVETNIIHSAYKTGVKKLLFLGSTCIYPKAAPQPIGEDSLLTGALEETNQWYAVAKIAGIKMCQAYNLQYGTDFIAVMPTNLYGPNDNFDELSSHVLPAMLRKFDLANKQAAPEVVVWGSGAPRREFLHVDDLADACLFLMDRHTGNQLVNIGTGIDISIADLAELVKEVVGYPGEIVYDATKPDGMMLKCSDVTRLTSMGWQAKIPLIEGVRETYRWYIQHYE